MKLKYYLRGVGIGIIFATLVMALSCVVHNYNLSDEFIIKEAMKLGMVMKDSSEEDDSAFVDKDTEDIDATEGLDSTQVAGSEVESTEGVTESESELVSEITSESETLSESENVSESETTDEPEAPTDSQAPSDGEYVTIVIERGDFARQVAEKLYAAGLIEDSEDFRIYMGTHGCAKSIHAGTYYIQVGATYEEICRMVAH